MFRFSLQTLSEIFLILRRTVRDMIKNVYWSSCKVPFFCQILINLYFSDKFSKNKKIPNFMEISPVEDESFPTRRHMDGRTE